MAKEELNGSVGSGVIVGADVGCGLAVGAGLIVGANDHSLDDPRHMLLLSLRSKHSHLAGETE